MFLKIIAIFATCSWQKYNLYDILYEKTVSLDGSAADEHSRIGPAPDRYPRPRSGGVSSPKSTTMWSITSIAMG